MTWNGPVFCEGVSATNALVDAAKEAPAIPSTDTALLARFPFEARFACDIAEFLLLSIEQMDEAHGVITSS
jgi:hypothetical protein